MRGTGFQNWPTISCRFGYDVTPARWLDTNHLECSTAAHTPGSVALTVSLNGYEFVPVGARTLTFSYNLGVGVTSVEPTSGPLGGGTRVVVSGSGFANTTELACRFGTEMAPFATFVDSGHVVCPTPRAAVRAFATDGTVSVPVSVTLNGVDFSTETGTFRYVAVPVVTAVKPSVLAPEYRRPEDTDTPRTVLLSGARFFDSSKIRCQFTFGTFGSDVDGTDGGDGGGAEGGDGDGDGQSVRVLGRWLSSSLLLCPVPREVSLASTNNGTARRVRVSATNDGASYGSTSAILTMAAVAVPFDLTPKLGSVTGGTTISVLVNGLATTGSATCRFGGTQLRPATLSKPATSSSWSSS